MSPTPSVSCTDVEPTLNHIWREFRSEGITDDLAIIEHLALLFLTHQAGVWDAVAKRLCQRGGCGDYSTTSSKNSRRTFWAWRQSVLPPSDQFG